MKETRKQKEARQRRFAAEQAAERVFGPIRDAIDRGDLVVGPAPRPVKPPRNFSPPYPPASLGKDA